MTKDNKHIKDLVLRIVSKNDPGAQRDFFILFYDRLVAYVFTVIKMIEPARDIVSDLFSKIFSNPQPLKAVHNVESYLFRSAKNSALNFLNLSANRQRITVEEESLYELVWEYKNPESELLYNELRQQVSDVINSFPDRRKLIYHMVVDEGMKYQEVAELLDISVRTVNNQLTKAVKTLRTHISLYRD
ncbi:MAG: sigma-70 family RNA polymerase sigma factor [Cytophagales bacterium]|nr:sigma-70 family RNA polymerase sigma factor [Cytophagales bacterium]